MNPFVAFNYASALVSVYTIYRTSRAPILTRFLKRAIAIQILNIGFQLIGTHPDNTNKYSLAAIITNIIAKCFMTALGLVDLQILTLFSSIDERLSKKVLNFLHYCILVGSIAATLPNLAGFILYFTTWQYRKNFLDYAQYASIIVLVLLFTLVSYFYGRVFRNLYRFKRSVPDALEMSKALLILAYVIVFNFALLLLMLISQVHYPEWYSETHKVLIALLGNHSFMQLAFFLRAKVMALLKNDLECMDTPKVKVVMLLDVVHQDTGKTHPKNSNDTADLANTVLLKSKFYPLNTAHDSQ